ncbi:multisubunit Na+/H+ antiporter MnhG subunit [Pullulanibacillus pueri]|uniref:Uncharacterized protein n=1 Tax=Pullulanibacillus pueri TaxID=1437324 RepID=A0A8J3EPU8_9BACL|nr:hypothetical protein [Pullulanibacillus pueri]MBM7683430.1 multisubunit Na+/H+ antiporter MnhG subunit [Pullulanibacillus pueri]GGH87376.1 hypothetical protein GCM10007096_37250 [Pullulanibacillus pueri]
MFILIALFIIIGLCLLAHTALGLSKQRNYSFKNAALKKQQNTLVLLGIVGVLCLLFAFLLI